jgi:hypothetical protein
MPVAPLRFVKTHALSLLGTTRHVDSRKTAISHELELYTLNTRDFKLIPELNLYPIE